MSFTVTTTRNPDVEFDYFPDRYLIWGSKAKATNLTFHLNATRSGLRGFADFGES